eukprot:1176891-Prorocentrum_minimum.AAC.1
MHRDRSRGKAKTDLLRIAVNLLELLSTYCELLCQGKAKKTLTSEGPSTCSRVCTRTGGRQQCSARPRGCDRDAPL